ncbi:type VI secretion system accessory protein TagJ [Paraglaciecola arctica]|uniref:Type VI secretion system protein ImpE n=1 Tax=Paraglaciecola arctica BSs20135 TaxID=493475 RepID=K6YY82_9ALTE|nr:type VI secretion system accessory protein TagJ [Paraglaciecola arctica]GAC21708.1 type VI secretion system protein ImpE [Paraglaciecola arctica BSs20135]|tara:strand:+ start:3775 stop:4563 length:789 start_codon:yes stop_codon:yes gene_type:complete
MNAESLLKSGDLASCKIQLFNEIKKDPSNLQLRIFLFQLSCINRDWQRAVTQLDVLKDLSDSTLAMVSTYKQLIECEFRREKVLSGDIQPICFGEPSSWLASYVEAYKQYCLNDIKQANELLQNGAELAPAISGTIDDEPFEWLSDGDVRFGPAIEVMLNGGYYWLPLEYISEINFEPVDDLRDLVWRPANLTLKNKGQLVVFMPVRYPITAQTTDAQLLARTCDWQEPLEHFYVGSGQRVFITDKAEYPILNIKSIKLHHD